MVMKGIWLTFFLFKTSRWFWGNEYTVLMKKEHAASQVIITEIMTTQI